jgi:catechol 2,3-dioxygenase-like lactoylglutathione lyase family enzyme
MAMKSEISNLVERFESGKLSRRDLVQGLALLFASTSALSRNAAAAEAPAPPGLTATGVDHVSVLVSDVNRSAKFYQDLFGLSVLSEDQEHGIVRLGRKRVIVSIRKEQPYGTVDHFGIGVENFNKAAVTQLLQQRGLTASENWQYGFYLKDPDGMNVQIL